MSEINQATNSLDTNYTGAISGAVAQRAVVATGAILLGTILMLGTGFTHISVVHNASHDVRHSMGFPCH